MSSLSESALRAAASWQAFKEGKDLARRGVATVVKATPTGFQGSVRVGQRLHRTRVTVHSPSHLEAHCSCPENQATGAVCAHAVALGLAILSPAAPSPAPTPTCAPGHPAAAPSQAWNIQLPPNWSESLARARLAASLSHSADPPDPADDALCQWLASVGTPAAKSPQHLQLSATHLGDFLACLIGHPRLTAAPDQRSIEILDDAKLPLLDLTRQGTAVRLVPEPQTTPILRVGDAFWRISPPTGTLARLRTSSAVVEQLLAGQTAELPLASFLAELETLQGCLEFPPDCWIQSVHFIPAPCLIGLALDGSLQQLKASLSIQYGDSPSLIPGQPGPSDLPHLIGPDRCEVRNTAAEELAVATLTRAGFTASQPALGQWTLSDQSAIPEFLAHTLPHLQHPWQISESARLARTRSQLQIVQPKIQILGSGEDWLSFDLSFETTDGSSLSHAEVQRLLRSGKPKNSKHRNSEAIVSNDVSSIVGPLFEELDLRQEGGHFHAGKLAAAVIKFIQNNIDKPLYTSRLQNLPNIEKAHTMRVDYRPYQATGIDWLADRMFHYQGALLADDMGLGKTIQAIALIEHLLLSRNPDDPGLVLVVATASLLGNWAAEIARFAPGRPVHTLHGGNRDALRDRIEPGGVVLTSYSTLPRDLAWHLRQSYLLVVADEASLMRNPDTDHAKALFKLRANHRLALSGTPLENGVRDLWSIFHFILPGWLGNRASFRDRYEIPLAANPPDTATLERLRLKTAPFLLRRTKTQVATDLPAKLVINEFCDLSSTQLATYQQLIREGRQRIESIDRSSNPGAARIQLLTALLRLRQTCCDLALLGNDRFERLPVPQRSAKLERLLELLEDAFSSGHKVLVFSQFRTQLLEIEKLTSIRGWASVRLDGQSRNRQQLVNQFQSADGPPLFLISLKAGGYGLNLTAADTVIHFDPWWNPAAEAQATDRAHRIGQTRPVTIYRLLTRNTVEEKVLRLQARKRELASLIDESGQADAPALTLAELQSILD